MQTVLRKCQLWQLGGKRKVYALLQCRRDPWKPQHASDCGIHQRYTRRCGRGTEALYQAHQSCQQEVKDKMTLVSWGYAPWWAGPELGRRNYILRGGELEPQVWSQNHYLEPGRICLWCGDGYHGSFFLLKFLSPFWCIVIGRVPSLTERQWNDLLSDLLTVREKAYRCVESSVCHEVCCVYCLVLVHYENPQAKLGLQLKG